MRITLLISLMAVSLVASSHDIRLAIFELSQTGEQLSLNISFDKEDLEKSLAEAYEGYSISLSADVQKAYIAEYLESNFQISINETCCAYKIDEIRFDGEFIRINAGLSSVTQQVTKIAIQNTCLVNSIDGHSNLFKSLLHGKSRTFRLTEDRISTTFTYEV